jgi:hypothetical protein
MVFLIILKLSKTKCLLLRNIVALHLWISGFKTSSYFFSFFILFYTLFRILCAAGVLPPEVGVFQGPAEPGGPARHIALLRLLHHGGNEGARFTCARIYRPAFS